MGGRKGGNRVESSAYAWLQLIETAWLLLLLRLKSAVPREKNPKLFRKGIIFRKHSMQVPSLSCPGKQECFHCMWLLIHSSEKNQNPSTRRLNIMFSPDKMGFCFCNPTEIQLKYWVIDHGSPEPTPLPSPARLPLFFLNWLDWRTTWRNLLPLSILSSQCRKSNVGKRGCRVGSGFFLFQTHLHDL